MTKKKDLHKKGILSARPRRVPIVQANNNRMDSRFDDDGYGGDGYYGDDRSFAATPPRRAWGERGRGRGKAVQVDIRLTLLG